MSLPPKFVCTLHTWRARRHLTILTTTTFALDLASLGVAVLIVLSTHSSISVPLLSTSSYSSFVGSSTTGSSSLIQVYLNSSLTFLRPRYNRYKSLPSADSLNLSLNSLLR
ncbi:hypothetical protein EDD36DRAFT_436756 [Exophiala viscosa]|uniref:Uncharacterized protein n=1 Tax=Exophiala viscosa TaxID=2486360 RepID=A0AAN6DVH0_9EURO|nr:hypothetical protein EDD36DRAFT_436756 [Exophiala viscosa]